jgi:glycosyltransferase involved in cell wall biosynthesis
MKIVIDATSLLLPSAGVKTYLQYWLLSLLELTRPPDRISTYPLRVPVAANLDHEHSVAGAVSTRLRLDLVRFCNLPGNPAIHWLLPRADVFHCSQHTSNAPRSPALTATVFDLSCWVTPQYHTRRNIEATLLYGERILKAAAGLIAISGHARDDAAEVLRVPRERIRVIYPGVADPYFAVTDAQERSARQRHGLDRPYLLFVGCIEPRKNVRGILRAYLALPESVRRDLSLVLAGPFGWEDESVRALLTRSGAGVRYLGYVPEADLPGMIRGAQALVYPSYYEGFGLPAAQAMAAGVPVIGSDRSSLPEVIGDAGILVDPDSLEQLRDAMQKLSTAGELRRSLGARGRARAQRFRWKVCAAESLKFFREFTSRG